LVPERGGDPQKSSDWDLLVLIDTELPFLKRKGSWSNDLHLSFPGYSFDILIKNSAVFEKEKLPLFTKPILRERGMKEEIISC